MKLNGLLGCEPYIWIYQHASFTQKIVATHLIEARMYTFLCRIRSIAAHRSHLARRLSVSPSVHSSCTFSVWVWKGGGGVGVTVDDISFMYIWRHIDAQAPTEEEEYFQIEVTLSHKSFAGFDPCVPWTLVHSLLWSLRCEIYVKAKMNSLCRLENCSIPSNSIEESISSLACNCRSSIITTMLHEQILPRWTICYNT